MKFLGLGVIALVGAVGCGGGSGNGSGGDTVPGINVQVVSPAVPAAVDVGLVVPITVNVTNDAANAGVVWSVAVQHKGDPVGTLSDVKPDSVTYNPPANLNAPVQNAVTATSVTDPTRAATIPISVYPAPAVTTQSSDLATAFVNTDYTCVQLPIPNAGVTQIPCQASVKGGLGPYSWAVDANTPLPPGLVLAPGLTPNDTKFVGRPTASAIYPFNLTVADSLGGTDTVALSISVAPSQLKVVTPTVLSIAKDKPYAPVAMQVSGGVGPYSWSLAAGSGPLPPGMTFSPSGVISGTPSDDSTTLSFAVFVKDSQTPVPAQAIFPTPVPNPVSNIIALGPGGDPTCLLGGNTVAADTPHAFVFSGLDANGPMTLSGSFTVDSHGDLTGGVADVVRSSGAQLAQPLTGSVIFDQSGRGCMTLTAGATSAQFRLAPTTKDPVGGFYRDGRIIEFDDADGSGTRGSGFFRIQDSSAFAGSLAGPYAFRFTGWDKSGGHFAMAGLATAEAGLFSSVFADVNDAGVAAGPLSGGNGTFSSADTNGRGTATLAIGAGVYDLIYYLVDANHVIFNSPQAASPGHPLIMGEATASAGPFSQSTLSNSQIYHLGGSVVGTPDLNIGVLHFDGVGSLSGVSFARAAGPASTTNLAGQYAVDSSSGRVSFSGTAIPAVGYLVTDANGPTAFLVGTGSSAASGVMEFQTDSYPPGYQFSPISNVYGVAVDEVLDKQTPVFAGVNNATLTGRLDSPSFLDTSGPVVGLLPVQLYEMFRYTFSADGTGTYGGYTDMVTSGDKVYYIDISPLNGHPAIIVGQRLQKP